MIWEKKKNVEFKKGYPIVVLRRVPAFLPLLKRKGAQEEKKKPQNY